MAAKSGRQEQPPRNRPFKVVVIGDACVGKTCMVMRLIGQVPQLNVYVPTIVENSEISHPYRGQVCRLEICDTAGQEDFKHLRQASYSSVDLFVLCFCLTDQVSFDNLETVWLPELHNYNAKVMLVGTKLDLCKASGPGGEGARNAVSRAKVDGILGRNMQILEYAECSALTSEGISKVLDQTLALLHGARREASGKTGRSRRFGRLGDGCDLL